LFSGFFGKFISLFIVIFLKHDFGLHILPFERLKF
jgi:hypothetical protein